MWSDTVDKVVLVTPLLSLICVKQVDDTGIPVMTWPNTVRGELALASKGVL